MGLASTACMYEARMYRVFVPCMCIVHGCIEEVTAEIKTSVTIRLCLTPVLRSSLGSPGGLKLILLYRLYEDGCPR